MNAQRQAVSRVRQVPAPVGGWDTNSPLSDMKPQFAVVLDNWFPTDGEVILRRGYAEHANIDSATDPVETLMTWTGGDGSQKMFAACNDEIYEVTSSGTKSTAAVSSLSNARWQWVVFSTSGGDYLYCVNGADDPRHYDGTTWATPTMTGSSTPTEWVDVEVYNRRLYFAEVGKLTFAYLPVNAIAGAEAEFDIGPYCSLGGYIQAVQRVSIDASTEGGDFLCFITSEGEVVAYEGTDPGTAADWALRGVYRIGKPIGRRCTFSFAGDVVVVTEDGVLSLVGMIRSERVSSERSALSRRIAPTFNQSARDYGGNFGWETLVYPRGQQIIFNIPTAEGSDAVQYVLNAVTGAWCQYTGIPAVCWGILNDAPYFGTANGYVYQWDTGRSDDGDFIEGDLVTAYQDMGASGRNKAFRMVQPFMTATSTEMPRIEIVTDYGERSDVAVPTILTAAGSAWGSGTWGSATWGATESLFNRWGSVDGLGFVGAVRLYLKSTTAVVRVSAFNVMFEPGAYL